MIIATIVTRLFDPTMTAIKNLVEYGSKGIIWDIYY